MTAIHKILTLAGLWMLACTAHAEGERKAADQNVPDVGRFIQIPGPNPIIKTGDPAAWDGVSIEAAAVLKDGDTYYLFYHGLAEKNEKWHGSYRIGVATASHPLGPWKKYEVNPIIDLGPRGAWDDSQVACATVLKEKGTFYLWYCAKALATNSKKHWSIGLATSSSPLGPWKKYPGNPVVRDFGYVGGVVKVDGQLRMYSQWPIGFPVEDLGEIRFATATAAEGPWQKNTGKPALAAGDSGAWDAGGFSEFNVLHHDGVFHAFYSSAQLKLDGNDFGNIGYAYSYDGERFIKYPGNPVAVREAVPNISTFSEVHSLFESPFYYVFHTQTYISNQGEVPEHIGVQVLATRDEFSLAMPVLQLRSLPAGKTTELDDSPPSASAMFHKSPSRWSASTAAMRHAPSKCTCARAGTASTTIRSTRLLLRMPWTPIKRHARPRASPASSALSKCWSRIPTRRKACRICK